MVVVCQNPNGCRGPDEDQDTVVSQTPSGEATDVPTTEM